MNPLRWRKMTWLILVFTGLMVAIAGGIGALYVDAGTNCDPVRTDCSPTWSLVSAAGVWITATFCLWLLGFVILSIIWFMARPSRRLCPICGTDARAGQRQCRRCGHDFAASLRPAP